MILRIRFTTQSACNTYALIMKDEHIEFFRRSDNNEFYIPNVTSLFYDITDCYTVFCKDNKSFEISACDIRVLEIKEGE